MAIHHLGLARSDPTESSERLGLLALPPFLERSSFLLWPSTCPGGVSPTRPTPQIASTRRAILLAAGAHGISRTSSRASQRQVPFSPATVFYYTGQGNSILSA